MKNILDFNYTLSQPNYWLLTYAIYHNNLSWCYLFMSFIVFFCLIFMSQSLEWFILCVKSESFVKLYPFFMSVHLQIEQTMWLCFWFNNSFCSLVLSFPSFVDSVNFMCSNITSHYDDKITKAIAWGVIYYDDDQTKINQTTDWLTAFLTLN